MFFTNELKWDAAKKEFRGTVPAGTQFLDENNEVLVQSHVTGNVVKFKAVDCCNADELGCFYSLVPMNGGNYHMSIHVEGH